MEAAVKELEPFLGKEGGSSRIGKYLIGTVKGDIHDIGKNLLGLYFRKPRPALASYLFYDFFRFRHHL
jgi:cobalamin-dependent methionine synthase I